MSMLTTLLIAAPLMSGTSSPAQGLLAIRVGRAETVTHGAIDHAVILIDNGRIVEIGQDLPIERGIQVIDRPEWTAMPGLVNPYSRLGLESRAGSDFTPEVSPTPEIDPRNSDYGDVLELGVTTLGIYPPGTGIPGHAVMIHPHGKSVEEMLAVEEAYLKIYFRSDARSKKMVKDAFAKLDEYDEKVKKAKEKFDKENDKSKSKSADKKEEAKKDETKKDDAKQEEGKKEGAQDEKKDEKKEEPKKDAKVFVPPEPDPKVRPFLALRDKKLSALVSISQSSDWLHWLDAIGEREFDYSLRVPMTRELDLFEIAEDLGKKGVRVVMEPELTLHPSTMRQRCLPMELSRAGVKLVLIPRNDTLEDHKAWLRNVGEMIAVGLDRTVALKSVTSEPAALMRADKELGSLEKGKRADLVFFNGDPFEATTQVQAVMLGGEFVSGEVKE